MKKSILILVFPFFFACAPKQEANLQWYENEIIEQVNVETDSTYIVQIGMKAQAFYLAKSNKNFEQNLKLLKQSLLTKEKISIGIEKNTAKIQVVKTAK